MQPTIEIDKLNKQIGKLQTELDAINATEAKKKADEQKLSDDLNFHELILIEKQLNTLLNDQLTKLITERNKVHGLLGIDLVDDEADEKKGI